MTKKFVNIELTDEIAETLADVIAVADCALWQTREFSVRLPRVEARLNDTGYRGILRLILNDARFVRNWVEYMMRNPFNSKDWNKDLDDLYDILAEAIDAAVR